MSHINRLENCFQQSAISFQKKTGMLNLLVADRRLLRAIIKTKTMEQVQQWRKFSGEKINRPIEKLVTLLY